MLKNPLLSAFAIAAFAGLAACGGADAERTETTQEVLTEPGLETVEVQVPTEDTLLVERTLEQELHVDTIRNPDQDRIQQPPR